MSSYRKHKGRRVLVQLTEETFDGTVEREDGQTISLVDVKRITPTMPVTHIDGRVVIERRAVSWVQVP